MIKVLSFSWGCEDIQHFFHGERSKEKTNSGLKHTGNIRLTDHIDHNWIFGLASQDSSVCRPGLGLSGSGPGYSFLRWSEPSLGPWWQTQGPHDQYHRLLRPPCSSSSASVCTWSSALYSEFDILSSPAASPPSPAWFQSAALLRPTRELSRLCSHWSSYEITALSLVESIIVSKYFQSAATPAPLCH